jgi:energy-coupling factor transporter ATP-binding protein EcfA2
MCSSYTDTRKYFGCFIAVIVLHISLHPSLSLSFTPSTGTSSSATTNKNILRILPPHLTLQEVSYQYPPPSLARRLFSSEPRRDFAVKNVSLHLSSALVLLTGSSSSGKSTLLHLMRGTLIPTAGTLQWAFEKVPSISITDPTCVNNNGKDSSSSATIMAQPVYLDAVTRFPYYNPISDVTISQLIQQKCAQLGINTELKESYLEWLSPMIRLNLKDPKGNTQSPPSSIHFPDSKVRELSSSQNYKLVLLLACLTSSLSSKHQPISSSSDRMVSNAVSAPILFLDEWLDKETASVIEPIQASLIALAQAGALIVVVTHTLQRWKQPHDFQSNNKSRDSTSSNSCARSIQLSSGRLVDPTFSA